MISLSLFDVYRQNLHSTQLGDNKTDTTNKLVSANVPGERLSLNMLVHKQGEEKRRRHAYVFLHDRILSKRRKVRVKSHYIHIQLSDSDSTATSMDKPNACHIKDLKVLQLFLYIAFYGTVSNLD